MVSENYNMPLPCRSWSNEELKKFAGRFYGSVLNVSGWRDEDKEGSCYKDYFKLANDYKVSNWEGYRADGGDMNINLEEPNCNPIDKFDVVFNHTTLEHIYDFQTAFKNLCNLTNDILVLVVPYIQERHNASDLTYLDYWRFTDEAMKRMCRVNKMKILYMSITDDYDKNIDVDGKYIFLIASKKPKLWKNYNWS